MDGDRPVKRQEEDRLGFSPVAEKLAQVIIDETAKDGLVFGIEGKWGSGKSTLVNLTVDALRRRTTTTPEIIEFSPWLVGARDDLLHHLFDELASAASRIEPIEDNALKSPVTWAEYFASFLGDGHAKLRRKERRKKQLERKLKLFGTLAGGLSKLVSASGNFGVPFAQQGAATLEHAGEAAKRVFSSSSLTKRKTEIVEALRMLSRRIVIFVDDLDRLEPRDASEVLRLIRAVADFPNVIYVLSFDSDVVANTLQKAIQVGDGRAYLEKIVQVSFRVPRPEAFDLRRWFQDEVRAMFPNELGNTADLQRVTNQRLSQAIDVQGGRYLRTPRDVVRAINSLRLHAIPVRGQIDIADMVWLQLVRLGNPIFYTWIEEYLTEASAVYRGAGLHDHAARQIGDRLDQIFTDEGIDAARARMDLAELLPGIAWGLGFGRERDAQRVFNNLGREAFGRFIADRRLGSPEHYRYYFAFAQPAGALRDDQVETFLNLAPADSEAAIQLFTALAREKRPQGGVMAEVMIERIISAVARIPAEAVPGILASFTATLDEIALLSPSDDFGISRAWGAAEHAVGLLLKRVPENQRNECWRRLFTEGRSLGWIASLLRSEIFAHGHFGDRPEPEDQRLLTPAEFDVVKEVVLQRFTRSSTAELLKLPNLLSLLYGWKQGANNDDARDWVEIATRTDAGLLEFLSRVRGWSAGTGGVRYPLRRSDLENFLDYEAARLRVEQMSNDGTRGIESRKLAAELLLAFQDGLRERG